MRVGLWMVLLLLTAAGQPAAASESAPVHTVRVTLVAPAEAVSRLAGVATLSPVTGPQPLISAEVTGRPLSFDVAPRTMWNLTLSVPGWWAAPVVVDVRDEDVAVSIPLLATGTVTGRLVPPSGGVKPVALSVVVDVPPGARTLAGPPSAETACSIAEDSTFACEVPAGTLDLSFRARGYVPMYRWAVQVAAGVRKELGSFGLSPGSAISGFLLLSRNRIESGKGKVELFVETAGAGATADRLRRPLARAAVAPNGFFQVTDVPAGRYVLQASYPGYAAAVVSPLHVYPGVETKLRHAVELQPPATLTLRVAPTRDANRKDWHFRVRRASPVNNRYDAAPVFDDAATDGAVVLRQQPGGRYEVTIADAAGNPFLSDEVTTAGAGDETHAFTVELVKVQGTLRRGEAPLAATIWFGGRFGDQQVVWRSDAEGAFEGVLPRSGAWRVTVSSGKMETTVNTEVPAPQAEQPSQVELVIPANHVEGTVVDESGAPLGRAVVRFTTTTDFAAAQQTDAAGHFAFDGVAPGPFTLLAESRNGALLRSSRPHAAAVGASESLDGITLEVRDGRLLHGRIVSPDGPVIGADVSIEPAGGDGNAPRATATSGLDGVFEGSVAEGFDRAFVTVQAPGYALRVFDVMLDGRAITLHVQPAAGTLAVTVPKDANGVFVFQDGRFLSLTTLVQWAAQRGERFMDGQTLRAGGLAPARYRACTMKAGRGTFADLTRCAEGFLSPYGELRLIIE